MFLSRIINSIINFKMKPTTPGRAFLEVTFLAGFLFVLPVVYYYYRENLVGYQNQVYYKVFGIQQHHLDKIKQKKIEIEAED